jgi:hypothetical protein
LVWNDCPFCHPELDPLQTVALEDEHCLFLLQPQPVLEGSGLIVPRAHRVPRFGDEPFAGRGMRYWLKQPQNRRRGAQGTGGYST